MKEELAISQGFGIMKNLNNSTEEKAVGENKTNTDDAKSGLSKFVCDRYPNIVAGNINDFLSKYFITLYIFILRNSAHSSVYPHQAGGRGGGVRPRGSKSEVRGRPEFPEIHGGNPGDCSSPRGPHLPSVEERKDNSWLLRALGDYHRLWGGGAEAQEHRGQGQHGHFTGERDNIRDTDAK